MLSRIYRTSLVLIVLLAELFAAPAFAAEGVKETVLSNGLRVLTKEAHSAPVVTIQVWYRVGSRNEHTGITGYSHLLEHMLFKGTKTLKKGELTRLVRERGGIDNAGTWTDFTEYWELLSSDHLEFALKAEADRMVNSLIDPKELKAEMVVVRSELEGRESSPDTLLWDAVTATAFEAHPYQWPIIGWRSDVEGVNRNALYAYYKTYYHPNNATLVIVGDFDTAKALSLARKYFGKLPRGPVPPIVRTVEPPQNGERRITVERPGRADRVLIGYHIPAISSPDTYPLIVLDQILSGGKSSRLYQALVQADLATDTYSSISPRKDPSLFYVQAAARSGVSAAELEKALLEQVERAKSTPVTEEELARAKNQLEADFVFSHDSVSRQAEELGYYSTVANWKLIDQYIPKIKKVTTAEARNVAQKYLTDTNRTVGWFKPTDEAMLPKTPPPASKPAAAAKASLPRSAAIAAAKPAARPVVKPAKPALKVEARVKPFRTVLANGMVVIVQENHGNPTVAIRGNMKAGSVFDPQGKQGLSSLTAGMLSRGTTHRTSLQLAKEPESVGATASVGGGTEAITFSGSSLKKDYRKIVEILSDMLRNPSFPADEMEKLRGQTLSALEREKESPEERADRLFRATVFPAGHPYHQQTIEEDERDLKAIARNDITDFYKKRYAPNTAIIVIAGDVDRQSAVKAVEEYFGSWQSNESLAKVEIPSTPLQAAPIRKIIPMMDKSEVNIVFGHAGALARNNPDFYAANVMNQILGGGGALSSRLGRSIRENMGLVYDVYSTFEPTLGEGPWYVALGANPANADKAIAAMKAEITRMRGKGATQAEAREAIEFITGFFPIRLETNSGVAQTLLNAEFYGLGMNYIRDYAKLYRAVTLRQVNAAAKKYLHPDRATLVIAGPYKGAP
ncbi:MAG: pitrilysin family protein [Armatimonadota bacterium]|nr:pitrilysin family protein [Armatimonadota bacterium]